jgi:prepilin peptidase CpaA
MISLVWLGFVGLVAIAAISDVRRYRIPNWASLALLVLFAVLLLWRHAAVPWPSHLGVFAVALAAGMLFFAFRQMGAGDAKFFAVIALWAGLGAILPLLFWTAIAGLIELAVLNGARRLAAHSSRPVPRVFAKHQGVPFGAAITLGAVAASFWFPSWLWVV